VAYVTVAHADLPHARGLGTLPPFDGVTLQPDRHGDGTNVIRVPADSGFRFTYGPGSFARHLAECRRLHLPTQVLDVPDLALDVDSPADLEWA
jgi:2-phospho-L-lactate guanylyltransferase